ncbi:hypothetical protein ACQ4PT_063574 [Festuca glaucescens]
MARLLLVVGIGCVLLVAASKPAAASDDVAALLVFKRNIYEDPLALLSDWNSSDTVPCLWSGVSCSPPLDGRVVTLELSNSSLRGFLAPEIGSLSSLQKLILDHNALMGSIPRAIGKLQNLTVLNLSTNQLVGPIPSEIGDMRKISTIPSRESVEWRYPP